MPPKNNTIINIDDYEIKEGDTFFFDNNIWMYIFCPIGNHGGKRQRIYSKFLKYILSRKRHIYINSLILSEFANRYLKMDFDICNNTQTPQIFKNFKKDYVGSDQFKKTVSDIKKYLTQIIKICQRSSDEFNAINIDEIFKLFEKIGFNDSYYLFLSNKKNWIIVSDDSDLSKGQIPQIGVTVLTIP